VQFLVSISAEFCVQVRHFDIIEQLVSILEDPKLQDGFMDSPDVQGTGDDRVFGELNTGLWWERTQDAAPEVMSCTFLVYKHQIF